LHAENQIGTFAKSKVRVLLLYSGYVGSNTVVAFRDMTSYIGQEVGDNGE